MPEWLSHSISYWKNQGPFDSRSGKGNVQDELGTSCSAWQQEANKDHQDPWAKPASRQDQDLACQAATWGFSSVQLSRVRLCDPVDCSTPGLPVHHQLPEFTQTHVHWVSGAIQPFILLSPCPPTFNLSPHRGLFQWVSSSHQVAKVLEFQLQHQSFQWIFRTDLL